jgi:hypothetical protein
VLDKTPLIYHETKSSICCWYLIMLSIVVYMFRKTMREIDVGTERLLSLHLTLSIKGVITKVMVEYSESTLLFYCLEIGIYYSDDGEIFYGPAQYCDVCHRLAGHVTKLLVIKNIDNMDRVKRARRVTGYNITISSRVVQSITK